MTNLTNGTDLSGIRTNISASTDKIVDATSNMTTGLFDTLGNAIKEIFNRSGALVDEHGKLITKIYDENGNLLAKKEKFTLEILDAIKKSNLEQLDIRERSIRFKGADEAVGDTQDYIKDAYHDKLGRAAEGLSEVVDGRVENYQGKRINEIDKQLIENELTLRISNLETELAEKKRELLGLDIKKSRVEADIEILSQKHESYKNLYKVARIANKIFWPLIGLLGIGIGVLVGYLIVLFG